MDGLDQLNSFLFVCFSITPYFPTLVLVPAFSRVCFFFLSTLFSAADSISTLMTVTIVFKKEGADGGRRRYIFKLLVKWRSFHLIR